MTQYVTLCMTQNLGATLLQIGVYDTKMYDTKCKTGHMGIVWNPYNLEFGPKYLNNHFND